MLDTFPPDWMPLLLSPLLDLLYILRRNSHHIWMPELWEWDMNVGDTFQEIASIIIFYGIICKYFEIKKVFNLSCSSFLLSFGFFLCLSKSVTIWSINLLFISVKENVNGVKFKQKRSSNDHNIYEFTFYHFGCIWKMCAFTMFHPFNENSVLQFCKSVHCSVLSGTLWNQIDLCI